MHISAKSSGDNATATLNRLWQVLTTILVGVVGWLCIAVYGHAERIARVETHSGALMTRLDRIEEKLDRLIERIPR